MASDQNRIGPQRQHQLLQMVLQNKLSAENDVTIRSGSPALSESFGKDLSGVSLLGSTPSGASQFVQGRGVDGEAYISDRYTCAMADRVIPVAFLGLTSPQR